MAGLSPLQPGHMTFRIKRVMSLIRAAASSCVIDSQPVNSLILFHGRHGQCNEQHSQTFYYRRDW
jgi:hypothetical protein